MASIRCSCLNMASRILKRPSMVAGNSQFPRTRTSIVPSLCRWIAGIVSCRGWVRSHIPSRASSKQCPRSQCEVKIVTLCPRFWRPTAASITRRSAPPMPRSGWKNMMFFFWIVIEPYWHSYGRWSCLLKLGTIYDLRYVGV